MNRDISDWDEVDGESEYLEALVDVRRLYQPRYRKQEERDDALERDSSLFDRVR